VFAEGTAHSTRRKKKWYFFSLDFFVLLQATNSHTNEVVAVKKMSYSGKQTNEVRWCSQF